MTDPSAAPAWRRWRPASRCGAAVTLAAVWLATATGCQGPCAQAAARLCEKAPSEQACEAWKERIGRVEPRSCEAALRHLDREAFR